jgi:hypothetical protein
MKRNKQATRLSRKAAKEAAMRKPGKQSNYARKRDYLHKHGLWGWEVPEPKPWKERS